MDGFRPKCVVVGQSGVGKTSMLNAYREGATHDADDYTVSLVTTGGGIVDVDLYELNESTIEEKAPILLSGDAYILVYSVNDRNSYERLREVMAKLQVRQKKRRMGFIIVGNKCDLQSQIVVTEEDGAALARETKNSSHFRICATRGEHVADVFEKAAKTIDSTQDLTTDVACECHVA